MLHALLVLALSLPAISAPINKAKSKARTRTFAELTSKVLKVGADRPIEDPITRDHGFDADAVPAKAARYAIEHSPDGQEHAIYVVSSSNVVTDVLLMRTKVETKDGRTVIDGVSMRLDPKGKLLSAVSVKGVPGEFDPVKEDVSSPAMKKAHADEIDYFLKKTASLEFSR